jgi:hypothetical protein
VITLFGRFTAPAVALEAMGWVFYATGRINADEFVVLLQVTFWYAVMAFGVACTRTALRRNRKGEQRPRPHLSAVSLSDRADRFEGGERPVVSAAGAPLAHPGAPRNNVLASHVTGVEDTARPADGSPTHLPGVHPAARSVRRPVRQQKRPGAARAHAHLRDVSRDT